MVITVTCPSCSSSFPVDPRKIPEGGVNARCTSCKDVFRVEKPVEAEPLPTLEDLAPEPVAAPPAPPEVEAPVAPPPLPSFEEATTADAPEGSEWVMENEEAPAVEADPLPGLDTDPFAQAAPFEAPAEPEPAFEEPLPELAEPEPLVPEPLPPPSVPEPTPEPAAEAPVQGFTFGKRDPTDKAKRLARVLVSDMIMYNAERHQSALAAGTLVQDFEDEIEKSWKEYVDQVGEELANGPGRQFWTEALNDILAKGKQVF